VVWMLFGAEQLASNTVDRVTTLTGRTELWRTGLEAWQRAPLTGAGPEFFETYATNSGQAWAGQAHNQLVQTLTQYGVVGLLTLVVYVVVMVQVAFQMSARTRATSVALIALLLVRSITETPLTGLELEHLTVYGLLIAWERASHRDTVARETRVRARARQPATVNVGRTAQE
jgi:O-antigen ligase